MSDLKKIVFIGGGSYQWVPILFRDIAVNPHLQGIRFVLHDIDTKRNLELADICRIISRKVHASIILETEDFLDRAIDGADAVILCISTGGLDAMEHDIEIPKRYGIYQPVGDSTGPGGISRTLRNVPVVVDLARRMEKLCPDAWLLNLTNPMNQIVRAVQQTSRIKVVGLCHEFQSFMGAVENLLGLKDWRREASATIAGINHFAWVTELKVRGQDGLRMLREQSDQALDDKGANAVNPSHSLSQNRVKFSLLETYGCIPYPGDRHLVEFFPYFLSEKTRYGADFGISLTSIEDRKVKWIGYFMQRIAEWTGDAPDSVPMIASDESLTPILAALIGDGPVTVQPATLPNRGQVSNLPLDSSVETLATFGNGLLSPHASGMLPNGILGQVQKHCLNQDLMVDAALEGNRTKALQAMLGDPLNNNNDIREIGVMLDELLKANAALLPQFFSK
jgi:alpha-galactosidase/6-phospho-beta-glucosidase family protein